MLSAGDTRARVECRTHEERKREREREGERARERGGRRESNIVHSRQTV